MTIGRASPSQIGGTIADATSPNTRVLPNNVTVGQLIVVGASSDGTAVFTAGDLTKSAGTATIGTVALDVTVNQTTDQHCGLWSVIVTGSGSLTLALSTGGSFSITGVGVYDGSWDAGRLVGTNSAVGTTSTTPSSGNVTSTGAALFVGVLAVGNAANVTLTQDTNFTSIFESPDGTAHEVGEIIDRIVTVGTTDDANWTIGAAPTRFAIALAVYKEAGGGGGTTTTKVMEDTLAITDQTIKTAKRGRVVSDTIIVSEPALQRTFVVTAFDELVIADETFRYMRLVRQMSDTIVLTDALVKWLRRVRSSSDNVSVIDETIKSVTGSGTVFSQVVGDTIVVSDGFVDWLRYRRLATDLFEITDGSSKTIIGAGTVYAKVQSDSVVLVDDAGQRYVFRKSTLSDTLSISDGMISALVRGRVVGDSLVIFDGTVTIARYVRIFTDNLGIAEEILRTYLPAQTYQVRIRLGVDQPIDIAVGGSGIVLGTDSAIILGVDR